MSEWNFYYLKIVKGYVEEYFIFSNYDFKIRPEGMRIFDDIDEALEYKREFIEKHKNTLALDWREIQICRL